MGIVIKCTCQHEYQDKAYGKGNRLHNPLKKDMNYRCTVCGKVTQYSGNTKK